MDHPRISEDPAIMGGRACIKGTRVPVYILLDHLGSGASVEEVLQGYPFLSRADIDAALRFAADFIRQDGIVAA
jgi:uncharacterized protein (DUF433 family)